MWEPLSFFNKIYMLRSISKLRYSYPDYSLKDQPKEYKKANSPYLSRGPEDVWTTSSGLEKASLVESQRFQGQKTWGFAS